MIADRWIFRRMVHQPQYQPGVMTPDGEVLAVVRSDVMTSRQADAFDRVLEKRVGYPVGSYRVQGRDDDSLDNPTMFSHGLGAARWHVLDAKNGMPVADLYQGVDPKHLRPVVQMIADVLRRQLQILSNKGLPRDLRDHLELHSAHPNPGPVPQAGQKWRNWRTGETDRIQQVAGDRVKFLGGDWQSFADLRASWRPVGLTPPPARSSNPGGTFHFGQRMPTSGIAATIRPGDRVTIVDRFGKQRTGRAVMPSSHGGWVLNMGGAHGTPAVADERNIVKVTTPKRSSNPRGRALSVPNQHRLKIARATLRMSDAGARIMGGMTKDEARAAILELTGQPARETNPPPKRRSTKGLDFPKVQAGTLEVGDVVMPPDRELRLWMIADAEQKGMTAAELGIMLTSVREGAPDKNGRWLLFTGNLRDRWYTGGRVYPFTFKARPETPWPLVARPTASSNPRVMDPATAEHFYAWLERAVPANAQHDAEQLIHALLRDHPDLIEKGRSWPEMLALAERNRTHGIGNPSTLAPGTRVTAVVYGEPREGTVVEQRSGGIVWVRWDGSARKTWMHRESLSVLNPSRSPRARAARKEHRGRVGLGRKILRAAAKAGRRAVAPGNAAQTIHYVESYLRRRAARSSRKGNPSRRAPFQVGEYVTVPYTGRLSYFGRKVRRTREGARVEGYNQDGTVHVSVKRGKSVESHYFPERVIRRRPRTSTLDHEARQRAQRERLEFQVRVQEAKAAEARAAEARRNAECIEAKGKADMDPANLNRNRSAARRAIERAEALEQIAQEREEATDPWRASAFKWAGSGPQDEPPAELAVANPRRRPSGSRRIGNGTGRRALLNRAAETFRMWHEFDPGEVVTVAGPDRVIPPVLVKLGTVPEVVYQSNKYTGRKETYVHKTKRPHPVLATDPDGRSLYLVGGNVKVTADGLVN